MPNVDRRPSAFSTARPSRSVDDVRDDHQAELAQTGLACPPVTLA